MKGDASKALYATHFAALLCLSTTGPALGKESSLDLGMYGQYVGKQRPEQIKYDFGGKLGLKTFRWEKFTFNLGYRNEIEYYQGRTDVLDFYQPSFNIAFSIRKKLFWGMFADLDTGVRNWFYFRDYRTPSNYSQPMHFRPETFFEFGLGRIFQGLGAGLSLRKTAFDPVNYELYQGIYEEKYYENQNLRMMVFISKPL